MTTKFSQFIPEPTILDTTFFVGFRPTGLQAATTAVVQAAGSGYAINDLLTVTGGTRVTPVILRVVSVSTGSITAVAIQDGGGYSVIPSNPVSVTGGAGVGATFNLTFAAAFENTKFLGTNVRDFCGSQYGEFYFNGNSTPTSVSGIGTPALIVGAGIPRNLKGMSFASNHLQNAQIITSPFQVTAMITATLDLVVGDISVLLCKNGVAIPGTIQTQYIGPVSPAKKCLSTQCIVNLTPSDVVAIYVQNEVSLDQITVINANMIAKKI